MRNGLLRSNPLQTKEDMRQLLRQLCMPLKCHFSPGKARLILGASGTQYDEDTAMMESFIRPLWGLVPYSYGGGLHDLWETYLAGISNGTNPKHEEFWGVAKDRDQKFVEMAAIGFGLALLPERLWYPLSQFEQNNLVAWLNQINYRLIPDNNWNFFVVLVNLGLKKVGADFNERALETALQKIDIYYLGDGWYSDGRTEQRDYYVSFAMHYYGLLYAHFMESVDPGRCAKFRERAKIFAHDFIYWFSEDGSAIPFGRSLTYKFAQSAFWSALAFSDVEAFDWGIVKGLVLRHLRWWSSQPFLSPDGILPIGYTYPNLLMSEEYNGPGSSYWAFKTFLPLALPDNHPFWTAAEEPMPDLQPIYSEKHPHMVILRDKNHVVALTAGQNASWKIAHGPSKYEKFAYSNVYGFSVPKGTGGLEAGAFDSMLALSDGDGVFRVREDCLEYGIRENVIYAKWKVWNDVKIETWLIPAPPWHIRVHWINSGRLLKTAEGGFAVPKAPNPTATKLYRDIQTQHEAISITPSGTTGIINLIGNRTAQMVDVYPNTNLIHPRTKIPALTGNLSTGKHLYVAAVISSPNTTTSLLTAYDVPKFETAQNLWRIYVGNKLVWSLKSKC